MYKDPVRDTPMVEIEIENRSTTNLLLPQGEGEKSNVCGPGVHRFVIFEEDLPKVQSLVETNPEILVRAREMFESKKAAYLKAKHLSTMPADSREVIEALQAWPESVEACFNQYTAGRDLLPLVSCKVIKTGIIPKAARNPMLDALLEASKNGGINETIIARIVAESVKSVLMAQSQSARTR